MSKAAEPIAKDALAFWIRETFPAGNWVPQITGRSGAYLFKNLNGGRASTLLALCENATPEAPFAAVREFAPTALVHGVQELDTFVNPRLSRRAPDEPVGNGSPVRMLLVDHWKPLCLAHLALAMSTSYTFPNLAAARLEKAEGVSRHLLLRAHALGRAFLR